MNLRPLVALALLITLVMVWSACSSGGTAASAPPPPPVTVVSVDGWAAMTLSSGDKVFDVDSGGTVSDTCQQDRLTGQARMLLVGRQVVGYSPSSSSPYATAPAGYRYGRFDYAGAEEFHGSRGPWQYVTDTSSGAVLQACSPASVEAPLSGDAVESGSGRVDVDVDHDDGRSRFCRRHWYC